MGIDDIAPRRRVGFRGSDCFAESECLSVFVLVVLLNGLMRFLGKSFPRRRIGVKEAEKGDFIAITPFFVILNAVKDLSKTRRRQYADPVTINDRFFAFGSE